MKDLNLTEINVILSKTLQQVVDREISHKQANMIAKLASTLSKNIANAELKERVEFLEQALRITK